MQVLSQRRAMNQFDCRNGPQALLNPNVDALIMVLFHHEGEAEAHLQSDLRRLRLSQTAT